jgi:hypothetical protein
MRSFISAVVLIATAWVQAVVAVAPTDEYRDADVGQSGYLPNHNLDPAIVDSAQFGQLWKVAFNTGEQVRTSFHFLQRNTSVGGCRGN